MTVVSVPYGLFLRRKKKQRKKDCFVAAEKDSCSFEYKNKKRWRRRNKRETVRVELGLLFFCATGFFKLMFE